MAIETNEPRALTAALAAPAFHTRGGGGAMHVANRHVERWAPEATANRVRSMRTLGFVDRLVSPWIETAQRSASLRLFSQYARSGVGEREGTAVSWVFPRPWYQDELDWMAASRRTAQQSPAAPTLLTTRGTYVAPQQPAPSSFALPAAMYEYVAPSLSIAPPQPQMQQPSAVGYAGSHEAYSPLIPLAAVQAAALMTRAIAPLVSTPTGITTVGRNIGFGPALRSVLTTMLERAALTDATPSRVSTQAPELVTPPAPRAETRPTPSDEPTQAEQLAVDLGQQRAQIAKLQQIAQQSAQREMAVRAAARADEVRVVAQRTEAELRSISQGTEESRRRTDEQTRQQSTERAAVERVRVEERVAQRLAERTHQQRLHEQARSEAAAHARTPVEPAPVASVEQERRAPAEVMAAVAALPPQFAQFIAAQRPERAVQAIAELNEALRTAELIAHSTAANTVFEVTRGPRLMMPAGVGGLVSAVDRAHAIERPTILRSTVESERPAFSPMSGDAIASRALAPRVPTLSWISGDAPRGAVASTTGSLPGSISALGATASAAPAAMSHVAWADRWLARFAGASAKSLDVLRAGSGAEAVHFQALANAAPDSVFVAPMFDSETVRTNWREPGMIGGISAPQAVPVAPPVQRFDDAAETPDDVFAAIAASAASKRTPSTGLSASSVSAEFAQTTESFTVADAVARSAPTAPNAGLSAQLASSPFAPALRHVMPLPSAPTFDVRSLFAGGLSATYLAGLLAPASHELEIAAKLPTWAGWTPGLAASVSTDVSERVAPTWEPAYVAELAPDAPRQNDAGEGAVASVSAPMTTLRTALLSWTAEMAATDSPTSLGAPTIATTSSPIPTTTARAMIDAMSLPMITGGEPTDRATSWTSPGMVAERAHGWSVAQERSASDLSLDFVTPELVLAARVYGLGPAAAAQAARLALAGPSQLAAMAGTVDRTFVQAMAIESGRRATQSDARTATITTAYPTPSGDIAAAVERTTSMPRAETPASTSFGVDRRPPRGAFLWPSATVAALGLTAAAPDGVQSMSVAALELLAAQAVAEIGTYAALDERPTMTLGAREIQGESVSTERGVTPATHAAVSAIVSGGAPTATGEPAEADVLGAVAALVPPSRRSRFDALYVALSQSSSGRTWSPAARAARALALAGRGDDAPTSAYERAATAWDVLPVVYATDGSDPSATSAFDGSPQVRTPTSRGAQRRPGAPSELVEPMISVDARPGLAGLSARAGEALGSYVTPIAPTPSTPTREREIPVYERAPSAAQELVRTGRPAGRHGGGEVEIPSWFEAAARKMLSERSGNSDGISMAELTLVTAAPASHVAASKIAAPSAAPLSAGFGSGSGLTPKDPNAQIDIEKLANEVYRQILVLMDAARQRNGEPYL